MNEINIKTHVVELWNYHIRIYAHTQCRLVLTPDKIISCCKQTTQCHFEFQQILNTDLQQAAHGESYICVCKKVPLFNHFFQPNQNGLSANKFNSMLYQLHFKPVQMFYFRFSATIHLNLYYT